MKRATFGAALVLAAIYSAASQPAHAEEAITRGPMSIEIATPTRPALARASGRDYLVYELHLTNFVPERAMTIEQVQVFGESGSVLLSLDAHALARQKRNIGPASPAANPTEIGSGQRAIVFLWVPLDGAPPKSVRHSVRLKVEGVPRTYLIDDLPVPTIVAPVRVIRPPVQGGRWVAANGPDPREVPSHNRLLYPADGKIHLPQRFATDWVLLGRDGRLFDRRIDRNADYHGYDQPVLAVADGTVVQVHDGVKDNVPPEVTETLGQADRAGNYVILDIGAAFAFYGHLKPGSLRVKAGQKILAGEAIALLGNSGNSTGPHLHFHVTNHSSLGSEGVPFVFDAYEDLGPLSVSLEELEQGKAAGAGQATIKSKDLPVGGRIVRFPGR